MYVFLPDGVFSPCDQGLDFDINLYRNSINQNQFLSRCLSWRAPETRGELLSPRGKRAYFSTPAKRVVMYSGWQDSANATVQLQGPFLVDSLGPPPAHRNVIMIAAGTGINPSTLGVVSEAS